MIPWETFFTYTKGHLNVQSCLRIIFQHQPISLQCSWLSVEPPIRFWLSFVYASLGISNTIEDNSNFNMPYLQRNLQRACWGRFSKYIWSYFHVPGGLAEFRIKASSKISTNLDNLYTVWKPLTHRFQKYKIWFKLLALHHAMWRNIASIGIFWGHCSMRTKTHEKNKFDSKYIPAYCSINLLVNYLLHAAPYVIYRWRNVLEKI